MRRLVGVCLILFTLGGCAMGRQHAYHVGQPTLGHRGPGWVAVAVQDQRSEVVSRAKQETFVGFSRGGFGNKFDINTASGRPLATDFADTISHGLITNQYRTTYVETSPRQPRDMVMSALTRTGAPRLLLVEIKEWKSDTYNRTALHYQLTAHVFDRQGGEIAVSDTAGTDGLGGSFMDPAGHAENAVPAAYLQCLENLLNRPAIGPALHQAPAPAATTIPAIPTTTVRPSS
jgi:hypothetical protein